VARFECAVAAAQRSEPLWATASQVRRWLLVEVHGAWGRDAVVDSELGPHAPAVWREAMRVRGIRVITIRRNLERHHDLPTVCPRLVYVVAERPGDTVGRAHRHDIDGLHQLVVATESLASGAGPGPDWVEDGEQYALVCTNGRHDACCATFGRPLARALRDSAWAERVWECSHIGGDRFAGNLVLLPQGLYFGRCDEAAGARVLSSFDAGRLELDSFRGRSTFTLPEQAAEHAVRREMGLDALDAVEGVDTLGDGQVRVRINAGDGRRAVVVTVQRSRVPSPTPLTCRGAEGLSYPAFAAVAIAPDG
jgi:hypothetical protein